MENKLNNYLNKELQLLINICGRQLRKDSETLPNFDPGTIDWGMFVRLSDQHKLLPAIYKGIRSLSIPIPEDHLQKLKSRYDAIVRRSMLYARELTIITSLFGEQRIPYIVVKGPYLAQQLYNNLTSRQYGDLDILTDIHFFDKAAALFEKLGYKSSFDYIRMNLVQRRFYFRHYSDLTFIHPDSGLVIELHWRIVNEGTLGKTPEKQFLQKPHTELITEFPVSGLSLPDHLLYMTIHGYKHGWYRLSWLWDVAGVIQKMDENDLSQLIIKAQKYQVHIPVTQAAILCHDFFGIMPPGVLLKPIPSGIKKYAVKSIIRGTPDYSLQGLYKHFCYQWRMKRSFQYRKSILMSYATHYRDWLDFPLPGILFPLYFVLHPFLYIYRHIGKSNPKKRASS